MYIINSSQNIFLTKIISNCKDMCKVCKNVKLFYFPNVEGQSFFFFKCCQQLIDYDSCEFMDKDQSFSKLGAVIMQSPTIQSNKALSMTNVTES